MSETPTFHVILDFMGTDNKLLRRVNEVEFEGRAEDFDGAYLLAVGRLARGIDTDLLPSIQTILNGPEIRKNTGVALRRARSLWGAKGRQDPNETYGRAFELLGKFSIDHIDYQLAIDVRVGMLDERSDADDFVAEQAHPLDLDDLNDFWMTGHMEMMSSE